MPEPLLRKEQVEKLLNIKPPTLNKYMAEGIITPVSGIPGTRFNARKIFKLMEMEDEERQQFSPLERRKMQEEIRDLKQEVKKLKAVFSRMKMFVAETEYQEYKGKED